ncbi:MAG: YoaK family protein [Pseudomonadota bacterium]|nr:YoaK family protein [Pseudomonadota bacterium]MEE3319759.1 YoaK family protein [Pseudomonadota bacterium]
MLTRLPPWVEVGAFLLAFLAGSVNAVGLLGFSHQSVSHLTGTSSLLGLALADLDLSVALHLLLTLLSFLAGSALSGLLITSTALKLGRHYGFSLLIEAGLLILAMVSLQRGSDLGIYLASMACGLQNAMVTTYSGSIIRTTHLSGIFTDLGIMLGNWLRGTPLDARRLWLFLLLIAGFICGGVLGTLLFRQLHFVALMVPATLAASLAVIYWGYSRRRD